MKLLFSRRKHDQFVKLLEQIVAFARGENTLARDDLLMPNHVTNLGVTLGRARREAPSVLR